MVKQTKKKSMTKLKSNKSNKFKLCRNKICADTRSIKSNKKIKRGKFHRILYYFIEKSNKKIYLVEKDSYEILKDKVGYLIEVSYEYFINEFFNNRHQITMNIMIFTKYSLEQIKVDPSWSNDSGISQETPYSFGWNFSKIGRDKMPKQIKIIKTKATKLDKNIFDKYIKSMSSKLKKIDYELLDPYEDTYNNLLDKYYNECIRSNIDVFKMSYYA